MKYLIKKLIKKLTKSNAFSDGFERSSTPPPLLFLPPFADASNSAAFVIVVVVISVDPFFFFGCAVVFGVLFAPQHFVGTQNAVLHLDSSRHSIVVVATVSESGLTSKKEDGRS